LLNRDEQLARLSRERFDLAVIGGGINGAAIARDAAMRGLSVALIERGDFAGATSSRSSTTLPGAPASAGSASPRPGRWTSSPAP